MHKYKYQHMNVIRKNDQLKKFGHSNSRPYS